VSVIKTRYGRVAMKGVAVYVLRSGSLLFVKVKARDDE